MNSNNKESIVKSFVEFFTEKERLLMEQWNELQESLSGETKSTAGDKHETGRASIHLEQENLAKQIKLLKSEIDKFKKINFTINSHTVSLGTLVITKDVNFLYSGVSGRIELHHKPTFSISQSSPIAQQLQNLTKGDDFIFGKSRIKILEII